SRSIRPRRPDSSRSAPFVRLTGHTTSRREETRSLDAPTRGRTQRMTQLVQQKTTGKAVKLLAVLAALGLALTACAGGGEKTETVFTTNQNGVDITMTYYATGDEVTSQSTESVISYEALGVEDQDAAEEMLA